MEGSMGAGCRLSPGGTGGAECGSMRKGEFPTVMFILLLNELEGYVRVYALWSFSLAGYKAFPGLIAFFDDFESIFLILTFSAESK